MNFWCFDPAVFPFLQKTFAEFLQNSKQDPKAEFFIPIIGDKFINSGEGVIKVIPTSAQWFGVTYKEDAPVVKQSLDNLIQDGQYPEKLW